MSKVETSELATVADLLSGGNAEIEISLKTMPGKSVKIKKATVGEISDIMKVSGDNVLEQFIWLAVRCLISPKLNEGEIRKLSHNVLLEIGTNIAKFSGLDKQSVEKMQNLLQTELSGATS